MLLDAIQNYNLIGKIKQFLPMYNFNVSIRANSAVRIKNIRERLPRFISTSGIDGYIIMAGKALYLIIIIVILMIISTAMIFFTLIITHYLGCNYFILLCHFFV